MAKRPMTNAPASWLAFDRNAPAADIRRGQISAESKIFMQYGDVIHFLTPKVFKRTQRRKFHLCIDPGERLFVFINSKPFVGAFMIDRSDWPNIQKEANYISCNPVRYSPSELSDIESGGLFAIIVLSVVSFV